MTLCTRNVAPREVSKEISKGCVRALSLWCAIKVQLLSHALSPLEIHPNMCIPTIYGSRKYSFPEMANLVHRLLPETKPFLLQRLWLDSLIKNALDNNSFRHLVIMDVLEFPVENTAYIQWNSKHGRDWPSDPVSNHSSSNNKRQNQNPQVLKI